MSSELLHPHNRTSVRNQLLSELSQHREYASFVNFARALGGVSADQTRHFIVGQARKNALSWCKKWVAEGNMHPNYVPTLIERKDALLDRSTYYNFNGKRLASGSLDTNIQLSKLIERLGPRPAMTVSTMRALSHAAEMPFLQRWISKGLMGPFTVQHAEMSDHDFVNRYRTMLTERISSSGNELRGSDMLACVSYMHTKPAYEGAPVPPTDKMDVKDIARLKTLVKAYLQTYSAERVFLWVDQACKGSRKESQFDWLSEGLMPYAVLPVLKVSGRRGLDDVCGRLWLKVELTLGMNGGGVWWCDERRRVSRVYNAMEHGVNPDSAVSAVCRSVLAGYTDDLQSFWKEDFLRLQIWSVRILLQDRGAARLKEYQRSADIKFDGHRALRIDEVRKIMLEMATQDQFNPLGAEATIRLPRDAHAAWSDMVPLIELNAPRREDRVFYCIQQGVVPQLHRFLRVQTEHGERFLGLPLSETPTGEVIIGAVRGGYVEMQKVNLPVFSDYLTDVALALENSRLRGEPDEYRRNLCVKMVRAIDINTLSALVEGGFLPPYSFDRIEYVDWNGVLRE